MKTKPNLIDNSINECQEHHSNEMQTIERCVILTILLGVILLTCICFIGFYKRQAEMWQNKCHYQDSIIKTLNWKGAEYVDAR